VPIVPPGPIRPVVFEPLLPSAEDEPEASSIEFAETNPPTPSVVAMKSFGSDLNHRRPIENPSHLQNRDHEEADP
jgi:hypothetical protein